MKTSWKVIGAPSFHLFIICLLSSTPASSTLRSTALKDVSRSACSPASPGPVLPPQTLSPRPAPSLSFPWEGTEKLSEQALACHPAFHPHPFPNLTPPSVSTITVITHPPPSTDTQRIKTCCKNRPIVQFRHYYVNYKYTQCSS